MRTHLVRTTIALPEELLKAADQAIADGLVRSRNDLLALALRDLLAARQRAAIDARFGGMSDDADYRKESDALEAGFDRSSWSMLGQAEVDRG